MPNLELAPLLIFAFVTTFTPGPNNIMCTSSAALFGYKKSLPFMIGISSGFFSLMLLCGALSQWILTAFPNFEPVIRWLGTAYILWLAIGILRTSYEQNKGAAIKPMGFIKGFALQYLNPKAIVYGLSIYTLFLPPLDNYIWLFLIAAAAALITFAAISLWSLFGTLINRYLHNPKARLTFNLILVALLIYTAAEISGILS